MPNICYAWNAWILLLQCDKISHDKSNDMMPTDIVRHDMWTWHDSVFIAPHICSFWCNCCCCSNCRLFDVSSFTNGPAQVMFINEMSLLINRIHLFVNVMSIATHIFKSSKTLICSVCFLEFQLEFLGFIGNGEKKTRVRKEDTEGRRGSKRVGWKSSKWLMSERGWKRNEIETKQSIVEDMADIYKRFAQRSPYHMQILLC